MKPLSALILALALSAAAGCGGGAGPDGDGDPVPPGGPTLTSVSPASGALVGGTATTLHGSGFLGGVALVTFGSTGASGVVVLEDTSLTCVTPSGTTPGFVPVAVTTALGTAVLASGFEYLDPDLEPAPERFDGTYVVSSVANTSVFSSSTSTWGLWTADGAGSFAATWDENQDGLVTTGFSVPINTYQALANGTLTAALGAPGSTSFRGGLATDGSVAVLAQVDAGTLPLVGCAFLRSGAFDDSVLNGTFHVAGWSNVGSAGTATWGTIELDGSGVLNTGSVSVNAGGLVSTVSTVTGTYALAADGMLSLTTTLFGNTLEGSALAGGALIHASGGRTNGNGVELLVGIPFPIGGPARISTLSGDYWLVGLQADLTNGLTVAVRGEASSDGAGNLAWVVTENVEGAASSGVTGGATYTVQTDGALTVNAGALGGGVSEDGRFAVIAGGAGQGSDPVLMLLLRK